MKMDSYNYPGSHDWSKVNIDENYEVEYWSNKFGIKPEQLRKAVETVGISSTDLEKYFKK